MKWFEQNIKEKQLIYCNKHRDESATAEEIIKATVLNEHFDKFNAGEFEGAEHIKNDSKLFYSNVGNKVWQVCSRASDMLGVVIPNTYLVREIGIWGGTEEDIVKTYVGDTGPYDGLITGKEYRITNEN